MHPLYKIYLRDKKIGKAKPVNTPKRGRPRKHPEGIKPKPAEGFVKYTITAKIEDVQAMKDIAKQRGKSKKQVFAEAIKDYLKKHKA